jgi:hypothetical protein
MLELSTGESRREGRPELDLALMANQLCEAVRKASKKFGGVQERLNDPKHLVAAASRISDSRQKLADKLGTGPDGRAYMQVEELVDPGHPFALLRLAYVELSGPDVDWAHVRETGKVKDKHDRYVGISTFWEPEPAAFASWAKFHGWEGTWHKLISHAEEWRLLLGKRLVLSVAPADFILASHNASYTSCFEPGGARAVSPYSYVGVNGMAVAYVDDGSDPMESKRLARSWVIFGREGVMALAGYGNDSRKIAAPLARLCASLAGMEGARMDVLPSYTLADNLFVGANTVSDKWDQPVWADAKNPLFVVGNAFSVVFPAPVCLCCGEAPVQLTSRDKGSTTLCSPCQNSIKKCMDCSEWANPGMFTASRCGECYEDHLEKEAEQKRKSDQALAERRARSKAREEAGEPPEERVAKRTRGGFIINSMYWEISDCNATAYAGLTANDYAVWYGSCTGTSTTTAWTNTNNATATWYFASTTTFDNTIQVTYNVNVVNGHGGRATLVSKKGASPERLAGAAEVVAEADNVPVVAHGVQELVDESLNRFVNAAQAEFIKYVEQDNVAGPLAEQEKEEVKHVVIV